MAVDLGWGFERRSRTQLILTEDATRLHCHCGPVTATLSLMPADEDRTAVQIDGNVAGRGPISGKRAREQTDALTRLIGLRAVRGQSI